MSFVWRRYGKWEVAWTCIYLTKTIGNGLVFSENTDGRFC